MAKSKGPDYNAFGMTRKEAIKKGICCKCRKHAAENLHSTKAFRDYLTSGLCEYCHYDVFERDVG